jgi:uncharacterized protein
MDSRHGDWIQTFTGLQFWPLDPRPEEVCIRDIAHALANTCRFNGHTAHFYSVAEHCVALAGWALDRPGMPREARKRLAALALMHDAAEAYLPDVPRPLKRLMPEFRDAEDRLLTVIFRRFGIEVDDGDAATLKDADTRILLDEREALLRRPPNLWGVDGMEPLGVLMRAVTPLWAEAEFTALARRLLPRLDPPSFGAQDAGVSVA